MLKTFEIYYFYPAIYIIILITNSLAFEIKECVHIILNVLFELLVNII